MECIECGQDAILVRKQIVRYDGIRVKDVFLQNAEVEYCRTCGSESLAVRNIKKTHVMIGLGIAVQPARLSGDEVRYLRKAMRATAEGLAKRLGMAPETFSRWENGRLPAVQSEKLLRMNFLVATVDQLSGNFDLTTLAAALLKSNLSAERDYAIVLDVTNLESMPEYLNLKSPLFARPNRTSLSARTLRPNEMADVRIFPKVSHGNADVVGLAPDGENNNAGNHFALAA